MGVPVARRAQTEGDLTSEYIQKSAFLLGYKYTECRGFSHAWRPDSEGLRPYHVGGENPRQVLEEHWPCQNCDVVKVLRYKVVPNRRRGKYQPKYLLEEDSMLIHYPADGSYRADPGMNLRASDCRVFRAQRMLSQVDLRQLGWA